MVLRAEIEKQLDTYFPKPFVDYKNDDGISRLREDVVRISEFLTNLERMCDALSVLNRAFKAQMGPAAQASLDYYKQKADYYTALIDLPKAQKEYAAKLKYSKDPAKHAAPVAPIAPAKPPELKKALSKAFVEIEARTGFEASNVDRKPNLYLGFVASDTFNQYLTQRMHWKDPTVVGYHGEYTHRIQWYCIGAMRIVNDPGQVFAQLGKTPYPLDAQRGLWDFVCDRDGGEAPFVPFKIEPKETTRVGMDSVRTDFRAPEILTKFLIESLKDEKFKEFAEIAAFVRMRLRKRNAIKPDDSYFAMKIFNKNYGELTDAEKAELTTLVKLGVFSPK